MKLIFLITMVFNIVKADYIDTDIKYYLWTGIEEGSGRLLVDYQYDSIKQLKDTISTCKWNLTNYYKVIYRDNIAYKMFTYDLKSKNIKKVSYFDDNGFIYRVEIENSNQSIICKITYKNNFSQRILTEECSNNTSKIFFYNKKDDNYKLTKIITYKNENEQSTLTVSKGMEYKLYNQDNKIVDSGDLITVSQTRDILPVCIEN